MPGALDVPTLVDVAETWLQDGPTATAIEANGMFILGRCHAEGLELVTDRLGSRIQSAAMAHHATSSHVSSEGPLRGTVDRQRRRS